MEKGIVLQKYIAQSGFCSRREAEALIATGKVKVDGRIAELGKFVGKGEKVEIGHRVIDNAKKNIYIALNKPQGYTCSNRRFKGEKNIFELIPINEKLFSIGRLDKESRGLLIITNDGELDNILSHPRFGHEKEYEVKVKGISKDNEEEQIQEIKIKLEKGVDIGEGDGIVWAKKIRHLQNGKFIITLTTGKKRQIRRMLQALGLAVEDLRRISFAGLKIGSLAEGKWRYLDDKEVRELKKKRY